MIVHMAEQLALIDEYREIFRLDEQTRELGRRGVAEARRVLLETIKASAGRASAA
jgi:hypothetical protein